MTDQIKSGVYQYNDYVVKNVDPGQYRIVVDFPGYALALFDVCRLSSVNLFLFIAPFFLRYFELVKTIPILILFH